MHLGLELKFDHFYKYDEVVEFINKAGSEYPDLVDLDSLGKSYEGRDIWCVTITNKKSGPHNEKPAMYIDANIHAGEVTGSHVVMYTIQQLLANYGIQPEVTHLLDTRSFYLLPRVNPDGAELYLTTPTMLRSSVRPYPDEQPKEGLRAEDINGDGLILQMRIRDDTGPWKVSDKDPRLMVLRAPDETSGTFYRVYPEGRVYGEDIVPLKVAASKYGLDINRNFPANWALGQSGAGPYPLSEPETRTMVEFILSRPNISVAQAYHTTGGVIYRPFCSKPDDKMNFEDLALFRAIGLRGEQITGYECIPASHGGLGTVRAGIFIDWLYEHRGIIGYTTELWDLMGRAGADKKKEMRDKTPKDIEDDQLKMLRWQDENLDGKGFCNWTTFDHPELGEVEIGGWIPKTVRQNAPPRHLLEEECVKNYKFTNAHALCSPCIVLSQVSVESVSDTLFRISAVISNDGYMATYGTELARSANLTKPIKASICLPPKAQVLCGKEEVEMGHLEGRAKAAMGWYGPGGTADYQKKVVWMVKAAKGEKVVICVQSERAGTCRQEVLLG